MTEEENKKLGRPLKETEGVDENIINRREYQRNRAAEISQKAQAMADIDDFSGFDSNEPEPTKKKEKKNIVEKGIDEVKKIIPEEDRKNVDAIGDIVGAFKKYEPAIKIAGEFLKGLFSNIKAGQSQQQKKTQPTIQAPEGWTSMSPLTRLNYMYDTTTGEISEWYKAGERYEQMKQTGMMQSEIPEMSFAPQGQSHSQPIRKSNEPNSLAELAAMYPDSNLPSVSGNEPIHPEQPTETIDGERNKLLKQGVEVKEGEDRTDEATRKKLEALGVSPNKKTTEVIKHEVRGEGVVEDVKENSKDINTQEASQSQESEIDYKAQSEEIIMQLNEDNKRYLGMAVGLINTISDEVLFEYLEEPQKLIDKFSSMKGLLPVQVVSMIVNTPAEQFKEIFVNDCPEKISKVKEAGKEDKIIPFFEAFKGVFE